MIFEPFAAFSACEFQIKVATSKWERTASARLRRDVFCEEQKLFHGDDRDAVDEIATPIVALSMLGLVADDVVGTVRIHEEEPGLWWGSRLAVAANHRRVGALGAALVRLAVSSAHAQGCTRFLANVQSQNAPMFQNMHWRPIHELELHGRPHMRMEADLAFYPPFAAPEKGFLALAKKAA